MSRKGDRRGEGTAREERYCRRRSRRGEEHITEPAWENKPAYLLTFHLNTNNGSSVECLHVPACVLSLILVKVCDVICRCDLVCVCVCQFK